MIDPIFTATTDEITCLNNFISKFNISTIYNNYCSSSGFSCFNGNGVIVKISLFANPHTTNGEYIVPTDLTCLPSLQEIFLYDFTVSSDFIYYKFPEIYTYNYTNIKTIDNSLKNGFTQLLPNSSLSYGYYLISSEELKSFSLKLSYLANVQQFTLKGGSKVFIDCDSVYNSSKLVVLNVEGAINYPNVTNLLKFQTQSYTFTEDFLESSISNFSTSPKYGSVTAIHSPNKIYPYYAKFSAPPSIIDLSDFSFFYLTLNDVGPDFHVNGKFPFSIKSDRYTQVKVYGGNYSVFPDIVSTINSDLTIKNSSLNMELPIYNGVNRYPVDLSNNKLAGTIDKSWCSVSINVANNSLSGEIPSCHACYLNVLEVYNKFIGNSFTNLNSNYQCTTFKPNISRVYYSTNTVKITGVDIGFDPRNYLYNGLSPDSWGTSTPGFEYTISYNSANFSRLSYFNIQFKNPAPSVTYTFPSIPQAPTPTGVKVINDQLTIPGTFFSSYMGNLIQTVLVAGIDCTVTSVNFFSLTCTSVSPLPTSEDIQTLKIQTGNLTRRAFIKTVNGSLNNIQCTNCDGNNQMCDMSSGTCYASCPNDCSGFGTCSNSTGICTCEPNRQALDCSLPYFECPTDLCGTTIKNSFCNNQTGQCQCDSTHQGSDCLTPYYECQFSCGFGVCNNQTGLCLCDSTHQGYYCNYPLIPCLNNCSGQYCDTYQGVCYCDGDHQGEDCSIDFRECPVVDHYYCNDNGECDFETGICSCFPNSSFTGPACSIPDHYISSVIPSFEEGGEAIFNGWFGDTHSNITLTIGDRLCSPILLNSSTTIICNATAGSGIKNVILTQNHLTYKASNIYLYKTHNKSLQCPNQCSNRGTCNNGQCTCNKGFGSFDCSTLSNGGDKDLGESNTGGGNGNGGGDKNPPTETIVDPIRGGANVSNQDVNFQIYFKSLLEIDFNGNTVFEYSLQSNWELDENNQTLVDNKYVFKQIIQESCLIISTIEEINQDRDLEFAGESFKIESGSIKFTISINNYQYKSSLNTLKLNFISSVNQLSNAVNDNQCNEKQTSINTNDNFSNFNYIKISKNNKVLSGRFINRLVSDGKSTFLSTTTTNDTDSVIVSLSLPHCTKECIIDPDFSVLLEPDFKSQCEADSEKRNWVIPIAVVLPVAGTAALAAIGTLIYKKKFIENPLKKKLQGIANRN
ncbi:hypothetical protein ACTA71_001149 [Dictyostelium dimigraforme]